MAKRVRYSAKSTRRNRPARSAAERPPRDPAVPSSPPTALPAEPAGDVDEMPVRSSGHLTEDELRRAAELEAEAHAKERAAIAEALRRRARGRAAEAGTGPDLNASLSVRAAHEYAYVARDVRRIALTAGLMVAIMAVLHVLVNVMGVIAF